MGMDLSTTDPWKQGVEIRSYKIYDSGIIKIYSGEKGHEYRKLNFGEDFLTDFEVDTLTTIQFDDTKTLPSYVEMMLNPRLRGHTLQRNTDGHGSLIDVLEPVSKDRMIITAKDRFGSLLRPRNSFQGAMMSGNELRTSSDRMLNIDDFSVQYHAAPFVDNTAPELVVDSSNFINNVVVFSDRTKSEFVTMFDAPMHDALLVMTGTFTDNYVTDVQKSGACGNTYDNTPAGTDSIAFGGMLY